LLSYIGGEGCGTQGATKTLIAVHSSIMKLVTKKKNTSKSTTTLL
jgi:hypothetical protein